MSTIKRISSLFLVVIMLLTTVNLTSIIANAEEETNPYVKTGSCGTNLTWTLDIQSKKLTISGTGEMKNYTYSSQAPWKEYSSYIQEVKIDEGVTSIGNYAFSYLGSPFSSATLPSTLKEIGASAFYYCDGLETIKLPQGLESIGEDAFEYCKKLTSIRIPDSMTTIEESVFASCYKLAVIVVGRNVKRIKNYAFGYGIDIKNIEFLGDMPSFVSSPFYRSDVDATYPCDNSTWDPILLSNFGGDSVTWNKKHSDMISTSYVADRESKTITGTCNACNEPYTQAVDGIDCVSNEFQISTTSNKIQTFSVSCIDGCDVSYRSGGYSGVTIYDSFNGKIYTVVRVNTPGIHTLKITGSAGGNDSFLKIYVDNHKIVNHAAKTATCTAVGWDAYQTCQNCDYTTYKEITAPGHKTDSGTITKEPTCTANGTKIYKCTVCNSILRTEILYAFGHDYGIVTKEPTCTSSGTRVYVCSICDETVGIETINPLGHDYGTGTVTKKPTCTSSGTRVYVCSICDETVDTETINPLGHKPVTIKAVAATCSKTGLTAGKKCSVCNKTLEAQQTVAKKAHSYKNKITKADATNKKSGKIESVCTVCSATKNTKLYYPKTITLSSTDLTYTGKAIKPKVTVKDSNGKKIASSNYSVAYSNNKEIGKAVVTITFKGDKYKGKITKTFTITPIGTWVCGYGTGPDGTSVIWDKQTKNIDGFQLQYSTSKNFPKDKTTTVKINNPKATHADLKNVKRNTTYYCRIRTYKVVDKKTYYSDWQMSKHGKESPYKIKTFK